jgi:DNA-binding NtrC family response regulator
MMERAVLLCGGTTILPEHMPLDKLLAATPAPEVELGKAPAGPAEERQQILAALERCAGNQTRAAKMLGISRRTLVTRLGDYALPRPRSR